MVGIDRLFMAAKQCQRNTAVVMCLGKFRFQLDRLLEASERVFGAREGIKDEASVVEDLRRWLSHPHGGGNELQRLGRLALGMLDHPHHVQGIDVIGTGQKYLGVQRLSLLEAPLIMQPQRLVKSLRYVERPGIWQRSQHDGMIPSAQR